MTAAQTLDLAIRLVCAAGFVGLVFWTGTRFGRHLERLRVTRGLLDIEARQALRQGAEAHRVATLYQGRSLKLVSNRARGDS